MTRSASTRSVVGPVAVPGAFVDAHRDGLFAAVRGWLDGIDVPLRGTSA